MAGECASSSARFIYILIIIALQVYASFFVTRQRMEELQHVACFSTVEYLGHGIDFDRTLYELDKIISSNEDDERARLSRYPRCCDINLMLKWFDCDAKKDRTNMFLSASSKARHHGSDYIFACGCADNIADALCEFALDERISNEDKSGSQLFSPRALALNPLRRHADERPDRAHVVHSMLALALRKGIKLADPDNASSERMRKNIIQMGRRYNWDFFDRSEVGRVIEVIIQTNAVSALSAVRKLYEVYPRAINHRTAAYGQLGLMAVLYIMGVGKQLRDSSIRDAAHTGSYSISGNGQQLQDFFSDPTRYIAHDQSHAQRTIARADTLSRMASGMRAELGPGVSSSAVACAECGQQSSSSGGKLLRCSRCLATWFCSKECQRKNWKLHKRLCITLAATYLPGPNLASPATSSGAAI